MNKYELLGWLHEEHRQWEALLERIGPARMEQTGVNGDWSFKDLIAHLIPDGLRSTANLKAGLYGDPEPPPPWPVHLQTDDEINAWIYETNHERPVREILDESQEMFQQLFAVVEELPDDVEVVTLQKGERRYYFVELGDQRLQTGEIFEHYHEDHEKDLEAWLMRIEKG